MSLGGDRAVARGRARTAGGRSAGRDRPGRSVRSPRADGSRHVANTPPQWCGRAGGEAGPEAGDPRGDVPTRLHALVSENPERGTSPRQDRSSLRPVGQSPNRASRRADRRRELKPRSRFADTTPIRLSPVWDHLHACKCLTRGRASGSPRRKSIGAAGTARNDTWARTGGNAAIHPSAGANLRRAARSQNPMSAAGPTTRGKDPSSPGQAANARTSTTG